MGVILVFKILEEVVSLRTRLDLFANGQKDLDHVLLIEAIGRVDGKANG